VIDKEGLSKLATLVGQRNLIYKEIAHIIRRPAQFGHLGEALAASIFNITLAES